MTIIEKDTYKGFEYHIERVWDYIQLDPLDELYNDTKIAFKEHRDYAIPSNIDFDFEAFADWDKSEIKKITKKYHVFWVKVLDYRTEVEFKITWHRYDDSDSWFIAISKKHYKTEKEAREIAKKQLKNYKCAFNWFIYEWFIDFWENPVENKTGLFLNDFDIWEVEEECKKMIDEFLEWKKKYQVEIEYKVKETKKIYAKDEKDVEEIIKKVNKCDWYVKDSLSIKKILPSK